MSYPVYPNGVAPRQIVGRLERDLGEPEGDAIVVDGSVRRGRIRRSLIVDQLSASSASWGARGGVVVAEAPLGSSDCRSDSRDGNDGSIALPIGVHWPAGERE